MSAMTPEDRHIYNLIRRATDPLESNAEADRKKIRELEATVAKLRKDATEHLRLFTEYLASYTK